ncbi:MAG: oxidoreductase [Candidatus Melainabacteria bacterium]|nr:MAG: oxidoreductase [Candidatus Melainabacteria bacterium]
MISRPFGPDQVKVAAIGQGTWQIAESGKAREKAKQAIRRGIDLGMVHIDTAEMYTGAEELLAEAIKDLPRQQLFIVSKVLPSNASFAGTIQACEHSLKRLGTDYLDCFLLHWRGSLPLEDTMRALEELVKTGKIRSLGVSNFDVKDLEEAMRYLKKERIVCNQVLYNLGERGIERRLIPFCKKEKISIVGYSPFGKIPPPSSGQGQALQQIAAKHKATIRQIILAFTIRDQALFGIPKSSVASHTEENAAAHKVKLDQDDIAAIDKAFPAPTDDVPLAVL